MKAKTLLAGFAVAFACWLAVAPGSAVRNSAFAADRSLAGIQIAQNQAYQKHQVQRAHDRDDQWYQGQRGHWYQDHDHWQWRGTQGDQWYQGTPGHWYQQNNGWQFGSQGMVCNDQGRNCHQGGYVPANGEGMVSRNDPKVFWHCDSNGHHCHWASRLR